MANVLPKPKAPCQDCPDRTVGCHATCEKYAEWYKQREKLRSEIHSKAKEEEITNGYVAQRCYKCKGQKLPMQ